MRSDGLPLDAGDLVAPEPVARPEALRRAWELVPPVEGSGRATPAQVLESFVGA
jgi:hypothetical protein